MAFGLVDKYIYYLRGAGNAADVNTDDNVSPDGGDTPSGGGNTPSGGGSDGGSDDGGIEMD